LKGWGNYFRLGSVSKAYRAVDSHVRNRLRRWLIKQEAPVEQSGPEALQRPVSEAKLGPVLFGRLYS
jgi:hypothetical protein